VRTSRIVLFSLFGATVLAGIGLYVASTVGRGPAHNFVLTPTYHATSTQLDADAAAMVRRLQSNGFPATQASVSGSSMRLTIYGQTAQVTEALDHALTPGVFYIRPVLCVARMYIASSSPSSNQTGVANPTCDPSYLLKASELAVDTKTGKPTGKIVPDPALTGDSDTPPRADSASATVLLSVASTSDLSQYRIVAGPAAVTGDDISSVAVSRSGDLWEVDVELKSTGSTELDDLAQRQFHAYIAIDIDQKVVSAQLIDKTDAYFGSLNGTISFDMPFNSRPEAVGFADALTAPLAVPLKVAG
jgi:hypothetical protein